MTPAPADGKLLGISDLHLAFPENRKFLANLWPQSPDDWLLVAGDVGELVSDLEWALGLLSERFATVVWTPGNHDLWTPKEDPVRLRGEHRYRHLVEMCRRLGVVTPEDPYPVWDGSGGQVRVVPLFLLYDYTFRPDGTSTAAQAMALAHETGIVCMDEYLLHPDPYPTRAAWCAARIDETERRLAALDPSIPNVFVNHYPLLRAPTQVLWHQEFAQWCGTTRTADWHLRFPTAAVVYGHLHIPRTTWHDGVRFQEVSVGYPREWHRVRSTPQPPRVILPYPATAG